MINLRHIKFLVIIIFSLLLSSQSFADKKFEKDLKKISTNKIKKMLEKSIQNEDYIIAAKLRDELNIRKSIK